MEALAFREFIIDIAQRKLFRDGELVLLTPKSFDLLVFLARSAGNVVTKDTLLASVWRDSFVEEGNIAVQISKIRDAINDRKENPILTTIPGVGYCFSEQIRIPTRQEMERLYLSLGVEAHQNLIAVLPIDNLTANRDLEYLADGLTDSLINRLSRIQRLRVCSRASVYRFKNSNLGASEIAKELGVRLLVTGRITSNGKSIAISSELTDADASVQLWGEQILDGSEDPFALQDVHSAKFLEGLSRCLGFTVELPHRDATTTNSESYRLFLKGKHFFEQRTKDDIFRAILYFERSVSNDPGNTNAYISLIECYRLLYGIDQLSFNDASSFINPIAKRLEEQDIQSDYFETMMGGMKMYFRWDFDGAENHLRKAIQINPRNIDAHHRLIDLLLSRRNFTEVLEQVRQVLILDPFSLGTLKRIAKAFYRMGQFNNAQHYVEEVLEIDAADYEGLALSGAINTELGNYGIAVKCFEDSSAIEATAEVDSMIWYLKAKQGQIQEIDFERESVFSDSFRTQHPLKVARILVAVGRHEEAFHLLNQAFFNHEVDLIGLVSDPRFASLIEDGRLRDIAARIGLIK